MEDFQEFLSRDKFAKYINVEMLEAGNGRATASMEIEEYHLNSHDTVHGGAIFALADAVFAAASNSHGVPAVAINVSISYLKAAREGRLIAQARQVSLKRTLATYEVLVTDEQGELIANFQGMVYRKQSKP